MVPSLDGASEGGGGQCRQNVPQVFVDLEDTDTDAMEFELAEGQRTACSCFCLLTKWSNFIRMGRGVAVLLGGASQYHSTVNSEGPRATNKQMCYRTFEHEAGATMCQPPLKHSLAKRQH